MKTMPECYHCFLQQALRVADILHCDEETRLLVVREVAQMLSGVDPEATPPANAIEIYAKIHELTGNDDPYREVKEMENRRALELVDALGREVARAADPLGAAVGFALAGNIIDYGVSSTFDAESALARSRGVKYAVDHRGRLAQAIEELPTGGSVLYLCDNCGEIVYDTLLVEQLAARGLQVSVVVRGGAIINDALEADARMAGMERYGSVITNGVACPGSSLAHCSEEFVARFKQADVVISKGQGNYETLSAVDREIFFLLTVKCRVVARHMSEYMVGQGKVEGKGEMVVYHHRG